MTPRLVASLVASGLIGFWAIGWVLGGPAGRSRCPVFSGFLAIGVGLALSSSIFFLWLVLVGAPSAAFPPVELALLIVLGGITLYAGKVRHPPAPPTVQRTGSATPTKHPMLGGLLWLSVACATIAFLATSAASPHGDWDAWMTWNMHARAIFRGGDHWGEVLTGLPGWSHPDYPLLLPGSVARMWTYIGQETLLAPAAAAMLFTIATVGILYSSVAILRSRTQGILAALLLVGTPFFVVHGASQYADVPFGFFLLATLVLLSLPEVWPDQRPRLLALAGVTAGLSTWTKNEGWLFLAAVAVGYGVVIVRARGWSTWRSDARAFAIGLAPVFLMVVCFKIGLAPVNDLMSDQGFRQTAARLLDGTRYLQVLAGFKQGFLQLGTNGVVGLLLLTYLFCARPAPPGPARPGARTATVVLLFMLAGYAAVLQTAPAPLLATNIRSINRLLLQLWPSMLFAYFLSVRTREEAGLLGPPTRS